MKKIFVFLATMVLSIGALANGPAVNPTAIGLGASYFTVNNYTIQNSAIPVDMQANVGLTVNFNYPLSDKWSFYPSFNVNWNKVQSPFRSDMTMMGFDIDAKYTFNPGETTQFYVLGGPTYINTHFGDSFNYVTKESVGFANINTLTFNLGAGLQFPLFTPNLKLLVEGKYYYLPQGFMPEAMQGNSGYNAWNVGALISWKF